MSAVNTAKITVSQHAIDRAVQRFRVDRRVAEDWIRSQYRKATFISEIISDEGNPTRLFAFNRIAFVVADTIDYILTIHQREPRNVGIHEKVVTVLNRELRKAERMEQSVIRRVSVAKAKLAIERAKCEYNMIITPSRSVIAANTARITEINEELTKLDAELLDAKKAKSAVAKSLVAYL